MSQVAADSAKTERYRAFWTRAETDRPLLGATISTFPSVRAIRADGVLAPEDLDIEENLKELDEEWEEWRDAVGDCVWVANPLWAFPWHLAIAGCPIQRDEENLWAHPAIRDWADMERIRFDPANPWFARLMEFTRALVEHAAGRYPVGAGQLMLGPVDMMMQARGQEELALALHDAPEKVEELGRRCVALCAEVTRAQYAAVPRYLGGYAGTIRYLWAPGELVETAEDVSFMMSPAAHRRFVVPMHEALARQFPYTIVHLHSAQLHTVPNLLEIDSVAAIQITPDFGEDMRKHLPVLARVLERKPLIVHGVMTVETMKALIAELPARGLCLFARCESPAEARELLRAVM